MVQYSYLLGPLNSNVNELGAAVLDNSHGNEFVLSSFFSDLSLFFFFFFFTKLIHFFRKSTIIFSFACRGMVWDSLLPVALSPSWSELNWLHQECCGSWGAATQSLQRRPCCRSCDSSFQRDYHLFCLIHDTHTPHLLVVLCYTYTDIVFQH